MSSLGNKVQLIVLGVLAAILTVFLYTRPKFVVQKESQTTQKNESSVKEESHNLSSELKNKIAELKLNNAKLTPIDINNAIAAEYAKASIFDSAALYLEKNCKLQPSTVNLIKTADVYNQALGLALQPQKVDELTAKAQYYYNEVLKKDPQNLYAKTNLAGTYVKTATPMAGITMLREVIEVNPKYIPALLSLGNLSLQSTQYDKAESRFKQILIIEPQNLNAKLGLAFAYIELNKKPEAKILLNELKNSNIDKVIKDEVIKALNTL